jgi:hypothetical protein
VGRPLLGRPHRDTDRAGVDEPLLDVEPVPLCQHRRKLRRRGLLGQPECAKQPHPVVRVVGVGAHPPVARAPEPRQRRERFDLGAVEPEVPVAAERRAHPPAVDRRSTVVTGASM